jgi:ribosomal protein L33
MESLRSSFVGRGFATSVAAPSRPSANATRQVTVCAKKKGVRLIVTLECTESRQESATPSRYTTQKVRGMQCSRAGAWRGSAAGGGGGGGGLRLLFLTSTPPRRAQNKKNSPERLELMKYNKNLR